MMGRFSPSGLFSPDGWLGMSLLPAVLLAIGEVGVIVCYNLLGLPIPRVTQAIQVLGQYVVLRHFLWVMNRRHRWGLQFDLGLYCPFLEAERGLFRATFCSWAGFGSVIAILLLLSLGPLFEDILGTSFR